MRPAPGKKSRWRGECECVRIVSNVFLPSAITERSDLEVLLELHTEEELQYITDDVNMVGVNNRNLKTFEVDLAHSIRLCEKIDERFVRIAESGLSHTANIRMLRSHGFRGFLIGEHFMKQPVPAAACAALIREL